MPHVISFLKSALDTNVHIVVITKSFILNQTVSSSSLFLMFSSIQTLIEELMKKKKTKFPQQLPLFSKYKRKLFTCSSCHFHAMTILGSNFNQVSGHVTTQNVLFSKSQKMCTAIKCASSVSDIAGCCVIGIILSHTISRIGMASSPLTKTELSL